MKRVKISIEAERISFFVYGQRKRKKKKETGSRGYHSSNKTENCCYQKRESKQLPARLLITPVKVRELETVAVNPDGNLYCCGDQTEAQGCIISI